MSKLPIMIFTLSSDKLRTPISKNIYSWIYILLFGGAWITSFVFTSDTGNWLLENTLVVLLLGGLALTNKKLQLSDLSMGLITLYLCLHVHGSMHTYAESPWGYSLMEWFNLSRNPFDRVVHFSFGFLLAYPMREVILNGFNSKLWVGWVLPAEITLSLSGLYEIIEWAVADLFFPEQGVAYLGTQGDVWDAQKDMALAFLGSVLMLGLVFAFKKMRSRFRTKMSDGLNYSR